MGLFQVAPGIKSTAIGDAAEALVTAHALTRGYGVSKPSGHSYPYDLIIDIGGGDCLRTQVKSRGEPDGSGSCHFSLTRSDGGDYATGDFGLVAFVCLHPTALAFMPAAEASRQMGFRHEAVLITRDTAESWRRGTGTLLFSDFPLERAVELLAG